MISVFLSTPCMFIFCMGKCRKSFSLAYLYNDLQSIKNNYVGLRRKVTINKCFMFQLCSGPTTKKPENTEWLHKTLNDNQLPKCDVDVLLNVARASSHHIQVIVQCRRKGKSACFHKLWWNISSYSNSTKFRKLFVHPHLNWFYSARCLLTCKAQTSLLLKWSTDDWSTYKQSVQQWVYFPNL